MKIDDQFIRPFGARLTALRQEKGLSARDLSLSLGQSHNFIHNIESERNYPNMANFFYICEYLRITPEEFFDYENKNPQQNNEIFQEIKKLDSNSRDYILNLIKDINNKPK